METTCQSPHLCRQSRHTQYTRQHWYMPSFFFFSSSFTYTLQHLNAVPSLQRAVRDMPSCTGFCVFVVMRGVSVHQVCSALDGAQEHVQPCPCNCCWRWHANT